MRALAPAIDVVSAPDAARSHLLDVPSLVGDVPGALRWAVDASRGVPLPGGGRTAERWQLLADVAAIDVGVARVLEPHLDALAILAEAGLGPADVGADAASSWGVFAAEAPGMRLTASQESGRWRLDGVKPWCSLAAHLSHALVSAHVDDGSRRLFAVDLRVAGVRADAGPWLARGLDWIVSAPVRFDAVPAVPVGGAGWYLERPGFAWGGIGVAACWLGGATGVARAMLARAGERDALDLARIGAVDRLLAGAASALAVAAAVVDDPQASATEFSLLALRTRGIVAAAAEEVLTRVGHALGPGPLVADADHARRVADLGLYLRQHHAERDDAALGALVLESGADPW